MKIIAGFLFALFLSYSFLINLYLPLIIIIFCLYIWLLLKFPEIGIFIALLVIVDCFSIISGNLLWFPNFFRIRDVFFLLSFLPLLSGILKNENKKIKDIFLSPIAKCIFLILFLVLLQIAITKIRFSSESFVSILRMGRRYIYYAIFFPVMYIFIDEVRFKRFCRLFLLSVIIFCLLYIFQFIIGPNHRIFFWGRVEQQNLQGYYITRIYVPGILFSTLLFEISLMVFLFYGPSRLRYKNFVLMCITGVQTILSFGRAYIFGVVMGSAIAIFLANKMNKAKALLKVFIILILLVFGITTYSYFFSSNKANIFMPIFKRIYSTFDSLAKGTDTFGFRLKDSAGRIELIKENPIFGVGFVHDESSLFFTERGFNKAIRTTDSGIVTLLLDFGLLGAVWFFSLTLVIIRKVFSAYKKQSSIFLKSIILGVCAFYLGRVFSFITLADFVTYDGIVGIVVSLSLLELVDTLNTHGKETICNNR